MSSLNNTTFKSKTSCWVVCSVKNTENTLMVESRHNTAMIINSIFGSSFFICSLIMIGKTDRNPKQID